MSTSGFFVQFTLVLRGCADGTGFFLAAQRWARRGDAGGLWIILVAIRYICVCKQNPSLFMGRQIVWHFRLAPSHSVLASCRGAGVSLLFPCSPALTTRWLWCPQVCCSVFLKITTGNANTLVCLTF